MHRAVYQTFAKMVPGVTGSVLEVGALPSAASLLCLPQLATARRLGINLDGGAFDGFHIVEGDARAMPFDDGSFDLVLCNAMIEHVVDYWRVVSEIKRVTKSGGVIIIGAPGYEANPKVERLQRALRKLAGPFRNSAPLDLILYGTVTYQVHNHPGDYHRFSPQLFSDGIFADMNDVQIISVMQPPRIIGIGRKPS